MTNPEVFDVIRSPEMPLRADIIATDTLPVTGARLASSTITGALPIPAKSVKIEMWFSCSADNATSKFTILMRRKGGDWRVAFVTDTITAGTQLNTESEYLADTSAGAVTSYWSTVTIVSATGADIGVTRLLFSTLGYDEIAVYQTTRGSGDTWHVYWSVYTYDG